MTSAYRRRRDGLITSSIHLGVGSLAVGEERLLVGLGSGRLILERLPVRIGSGPIGIKQLPLNAGRDSGALN